MDGFICRFYPASGGRCTAGHMGCEEPFAGTRIGLALFVFSSLPEPVSAILRVPEYTTPGIDRSQAWDALYFTASPGQSTQFLAQRDFARRLRRQSGIVLSDIDPVYLNALLPRSFVAAPIDGDHHYKWSYTWRYERPQALALVERGLKQSLPVYALFVSSDEATTKQPRLPAVPGYDWHLLDQRQRQSGNSKACSRCGRTNHCHRTNATHSSFAKRRARKLSCAESPSTCPILRSALVSSLPSDQRIELGP